MSWWISSLVLVSQMVVLWETSQHNSGCQYRWAQPSVWDRHTKGETIHIFQPIASLLIIYRVSRGSDYFSRQNEELSRRTLELPSWIASRTWSSWGDILYILRFLRAMRRILREIWMARMSTVQIGIFTMHSLKVVRWCGRPGVDHIRLHESDTWWDNFHNFCTLHWPLAP